MSQSTGPILTEIAKAAARGDLTSIQTLLANGELWDPLATVEAAKFGHLNVLEYALDNQLDLYPTTSLGAVMFGQVDVLTFLYNNRCFVHSQTANQCFYEYPIAPHNVECFRVCFKNGASFKKPYILNILETNKNIVDMDDPMFTTLLLDEDLSSFPNINKIVGIKRKQIKQQLAEVCYSVLPFLQEHWIPKEMVKDCIVPYL